MKNPELYLIDRKASSASVHLEVSTKPNIHIDLNERTKGKKKTYLKKKKSKHKTTNSHRHTYMQQRTGWENWTEKVQKKNVKSEEF